jgi:hypothetical protein
VPTILASSQNRDVAVVIDGRDYGIWDTHKPGKITGNLDTHYPGGSTSWRVLAGKPGAEEATLTRTFDPDTDFWMLDGLTKAAAGHALVSVVDVYGSPNSTVKQSRKYAGVVGDFTEAESDAGDANAQMLELTYMPTGLPTS